MSATSFIIYIAILAIIFFAEDYIIEYINNWLINCKYNKTNFQLKENWLSYFLVIVLIIVTIGGMFIKNPPQNNPQASISKSMEVLKPQESDGLFNINLNIFHF